MRKLSVDCSKPKGERETIVDLTAEELAEEKKKNDGCDLYIANEKYKDDRRNALPPIPEQLDMIYWDKENGTDLWHQMIKQNKLNNPKTT